MTSSSVIRRSGRTASLCAQSQAAAHELFDRLESRTLYAGDFVSVGMRFETSFNDLDGDVFISEGFIDVDLFVSGDVYSTGNFDRQRVDSLPYDYIEQLSDGRYVRDPDRGSFGTPFESNGARFLSDEGFPIGWWYGDFGGGDKEAEFIVQRPEEANFGDFFGTWRFTMVSLNPGGSDFDAGYGTLTIDEDDVRFFRDAGVVPRSVSPIDVVTDRGRLVTENSEYFYLSADLSVMVFADMAESDGTVSIGVAIRQQPAVSFDDLVGSYLLEWGFADRPAQDGPNDEIDFRQRVLSLEADGDYRIWDLDDYDSGNDENEYAISRGFWNVSGTRVILDRANSNDEIVLAASPNLSTLIGLSLDDGDSFNAIFGVATRAYPNGEPVPPPPVVRPIVTAPAYGEFDRPTIYALGTDDVWEAVDLIREAGGPTLSDLPVSWVDPKDDLAYAAGVSTSGVILYSQPDNVGDWTYRNLTTEIPGAEAIVGDVQYMTSADGLVSIVGLNGDGELIRYYQDGQRVSGSSQYRWYFVNIDATDLAPFSIDTPAFGGELVAYATSWGGLNVAGLDSSGTIWSVWWSPGQPRWSVTNLSAASGAAPLASSLTVYLTPWNGINLAGIDDTGDLKVTWWVPSFGGNWAQNNLTDETGGPRFEPGSVSSYVSSWGGLNIVGLEEGTGDVKVYWWAPERSQLGWATTSLTASTPLDSPRISFGPLLGAAAPDRSLNVFGYADDGSFVCYYWKPEFGGEWESQNLTEIAIDR